MDVLENHDGVVHHQPESPGQTRQGEGVEGEATQVEQVHRRHQAEDDSAENDQHRAGRPEEDGQNEHDRGRRGQGPDPQVGQAGPDLLAAVVGQLHRGAPRQASPEFAHAGPESVGEVDGVGPRAPVGVEGDRRLAVDAMVAVGLGGHLLRPGHVPEKHPLAPRRPDR